MNLERKREIDRNWYHNNLEKAREAKRRNDGTPARRKFHREKRWKERGIVDMTYEQYLTLCERAGNVCEICRKVNMRSGKRIALAVDHAHHGEQEVRGCLCDSCNRRLGYLEKYGWTGSASAGFLLPSPSTA